MSQGGFIPFLPTSEGFDRRLKAAAGEYVIGPDYVRPTESEGEGGQ